MKRTIACFGLLCVAIGWCADNPLAQRVSYDQPAQALETLLRDLSKQTNLKLYPAPELKQEIVLVVVQGMPLQEVMRHLAFVADAEWIAESARQYRLARTPAVAARRKQEDAQKTLEWLRKEMQTERFRQLTQPLTHEETRKVIRQIISQLDKLVEGNTSEEEEYRLTFNLYEAFTPLNPETRLLYRLLQRMDSRRLGSLAFDERRVFSNANVTGRYLLPLLVDVRPLLEQWRQERAIYDAARVELRDQINHGKYNAYRWCLEWLYEDAEKPARERIEEIPARIYLAAMRSRAYEILFELYLADEENSVIASASYWNDWEDEDDKAERMLREDSTLAKPVEWRAETQQWLNALRLFQPRAQVVPLPEILDPAKHEPLRFVPSDVLRSYAHHKGRPIVALLDDSLLWWANRSVRNQQRLVDFLVRQFGWELHSSGEVILVRPELSGLQWGLRADRRAVSRWLHQLIKRGFIEPTDSLDTAAWSSLAGFYRYQLRELAFLSESLDYPALSSVLGRLMHSALESTDGRAALPLTQLSPSEFRALERHIYNSGDVFLAPNEEEHDEALDSQARELISLPHAHFPNGLPRDGALVVMAAQTKGVLARRAGIGVWGGFYETNALKWAQENADKNVDARRQLDYLQNSLLLPVERQMIDFSVRFGAIEVHTGWYLFGYRPLMGLKPLRWDELPPEFLKSPAMTNEDI
ncbi:MAG: hypothetical protein KatS3mg018_0026 [Fimbriimonadales bacterium]|nr:MAG: hypothetical protein KatS3mg018_0026 [Fimbriimonadales bacterium]